MIHYPIDARCIAAVSKVRGFDPTMLTLSDLLIAASIDPLEAEDIDDLPEAFTLAELDEEYDMRVIGQEIASIYLLNARSLPLAMRDLYGASRFLARWVYAAAVEAVARRSGLDRDQRIADRIHSIRTMAARGEDMDRSLRHRTAMWDRTTRLADRDLAPMLRGAAQDDVFALSVIKTDAAGSVVVESMAYACRQFAWIL